MSMKGKLTRQIIRSLREYPEDWHFGEAWARNDHLQLRVYKRKHCPFIDVWYKNEEVVPEWRNLLAYFVPWRMRLLAALRHAEKVADMKRLSIKIDDTFETPTRTMPEELNDLLVRFARLQLRQRGGQA